MAVDRTYTEEFATYLKRDMADYQISALLKAQGKSDLEIQTILDRYKEAKHKLHKLVKKIVNKLNKHFDENAYDDPDRIKHAMKYAAKFKFSDVEREVLKRYILGRYKSLDKNMLVDSVKFTEMSNFLGFDQASLAIKNAGSVGPRMSSVIKLQPKDHAKLAELQSLYEQSKMLYNDIKVSSYLYMDVSQQVLHGTYDSKFNNSSYYVHPVIAALYVPKINYIDTRTLQTNIGRLVLSRAAPYIEKNVNNLMDNIHPGELENEIEMSYEIASDPANLSYFNDDGNSPLDNLIKRFKVQVELWKNVINLRQGKFYGSTMDDSTVTGFLKSLNNFEWALHDNVPMSGLEYNGQNEGTIIKKLFAVFSIRPTWVMYQKMPLLMGGMDHYGMHVPYATDLMPQYTQSSIINIRLPMVTREKMAEYEGKSLIDFIKQPEYITNDKHKQPVQRTREISFSKDLLVLNLNRSIIGATVASVTSGYVNFNNLPVAIQRASTNINKVAIYVPPVFPIDNEEGQIFALKSVILGNSIPDYTKIDANDLLGVSTILYSNDKTYVYAPHMVNISINTLLGGEPMMRPLPPVFEVDEFSTDDTKLSSSKLASTRGTVFVYVDTNMNRRAAAV